MKITDSEMAPYGRSEMSCRPCEISARHHHGTCAHGPRMLDGDVMEEVDDASQSTDIEGPKATDVDAPRDRQVQALIRDTRKAATGRLGVAAVAFDPGAALASSTPADATILGNVATDFPSIPGGVRVPC